MAVEFVLHAQERSDVGKGASRRLRRHADQVPAVVYGGDKSPLSIAITHKDLSKALENEAFYSHLVTLNVGDASEEVILKDLQRHPAKDRILHADFQRVSQDRKITLHAPLHFINEEQCVGVKQGGGLIQHNANDIEISCLPRDLPEFIEVDMADVNLGESIHLSDIRLPEGVSSVALAHGAEYDMTIAVVVGRGPSVEEEAAAIEGEVPPAPEEEEGGED